MQHKYQDVIIAWVNGEDIEYSFDGCKWHDSPHLRFAENRNPDFNNESIQWRVKPKIQKRKVWMNVYPEFEGVVHDTRKSADFNASDIRIACIEIEYEFYEGQGLES